MFNGNRFNRTPFNRPFLGVLYNTKITLGGSGTAIFNPGGAILASLTLRGEGVASFDPAYKSSLTLRGEGTFEAAPSLISKGDLELSGAGTFEGNPSLIAFPSLTLQGQGLAEFSLATFAALELSGAGTFIAEGTVIKWIPLTLRGEGVFQARNPKIVKSLNLVFGGELEPGDVLVIDTDEQTAYLNGQDVTYQVANFLKLLPSENDLIVSNKDTNLKIKYTERYI